MLQVTNQNQIIHDEFNFLVKKFFNELYFYEGFSDQIYKLFQLKQIKKYFPCRKVMIITRLSAIFCKYYTSKKSDPLNWTFAQIKY